jgi:hypothetical protein
MFPPFSRELFFVWFDFFHPREENEMTIFKIRSRQSWKPGPVCCGTAKTGICGVSRAGRRRRGRAPGALFTEWEHWHLILAKDSTAFLPELTEVSPLLNIHV